MRLAKYHKKRDFKQTPEPKGRIDKTKKNFFCIQKHAASHLHYDFRLELNGVLKSWAVPKGPCYDPKVKRLAMHVEDHPVAYGTFEGTIPKGSYGGGTVMLWDMGNWHPLDEDPNEAYQKGHLRFELHGKKMFGRWDLIRFKKENEWFLIKYNDAFSKSLEDYDITLAEPLSVSTKRTMDEITSGKKKSWAKAQPTKPIKYTKPTPSRLGLGPTRYPEPTPSRLGLGPTKYPKSPFPKIIKPQLATLVEKPPIGDEWLHEVKFDGYRIITLKKGNDIQLVSRNNINWTEKFPSIVLAIQKLSIKNIVLDGEIVVLDEKGRSDFQLLQNSIKNQGDTNTSFFYYIFDLLYLEDRDLRSIPLIERKDLLEQILNNQITELRYSSHIIGKGEEVFKNACDYSLEGIVAKKEDSIYAGTRTTAWVKVKCHKRQEFVIGGFSKPQGTRPYFGSLYLGIFNPAGEFIFTGNVGTGFTEESLHDIYKKLKKIIIPKNPFTKLPPNAKSATWVKPVYIVEVEFTEWTTDGRLRHPSFKGLRMDKKPKEVAKEKELPTITHPDKILYPEDKITKQLLYEYYFQISSYILPFIKNRPLTLVRCPENYKKCFYQKHLQAKSPKNLHLYKQYIYLKDTNGLLQLVQMGALEIHTWGSTIKHLHEPDIIIFDLDPAPDVTWAEVVSAAFEVKAELEQYKLISFVKTTGGKGLHIVIPILPEYDWEIIKKFTHAFVTYLETRDPKKYISNMSKSKRQGKIFVDYLRNQWEATAIAAFSTRARIHAPVSTPIFWDELTDNINDTFFTIKTMQKRLEKLKQDPWEGFWDIKQSLRLDEL